MTALDRRWRSLDPGKIKQGVEACARALGLPVVTVRNHTCVEDLADALAPYQTLAALTLQAGAFGYPQITEPSEGDVIRVMLDFLRAVGQATDDDETKIIVALAEDEALAQAKYGAGRK